MHQLIRIHANYDCDYDDDVMMMMMMMMMMTTIMFIIMEGYILFPN